MSVSNFSTPSPIAVALDLYVADVRFAVSDRTDAIVEVRPSDPNKAADIKAAENTRVEYDDATRTLSIVTRKPRNRFVNFSSKRPESIDLVIQLPTGSDVRGAAGLGDFQSDGVLGTVALKTDVGSVRLAETGPLNLRSGAGGVTVEGVSGSAEVHNGSSDIRIGAVDGSADLSTGNGRVRIGVVTGPASIKASNGSVSVDRALSDITAASSNGAVQIGEVVRGTVSATSKNGSVEVGVREGSAAWVELNTGVGRVYNELAPSDAPEAGEQVDKVEVHASTALGDVTIRRTPRLDEEL
jgi:Putative adhesin